MKTILKTSIILLLLIISSCCNDDDGDPPQENTPFITTWQTSSDNETVTIPTRAGEYTYNYTIDWGDGTTQANISDDIDHTYATAGTYTISISGVFPAINMRSNNTSGAQLRSVEQWGDIEWLTMNNAFANVDAFTINALDIPNLSNVTDLSSMFDGSSFSGDVSDWDVSNATDMSSMFGGSDFDGDISNWKVSNVTNMRDMFDSSRFNQNISNWDVSNVTTMNGMFDGSSFNGDISNWNVSNVTTMSFMFDSSPFNNDISTWNVSNVTNMSSMFSFSTFNQNISGWVVNNVTDCGDFSDGAPLTPENTPNFTNCTP